MRETVITCLLDSIRHLIEIAGTVALAYYSWITIHWLVAPILVVHVYLAVSALVDFLMIPLYLLTPENRAFSKILNAIDEQDFSTALRVLKAHEKWHTAESQASPRTTTMEVCRRGNSFAHAINAT